MGTRSATRPGRSTAQLPLRAEDSVLLLLCRTIPSRTWSTVWAPIVTMSLAASWRSCSGVSVPASAGGAEPTCHCSETASSARSISVTRSGSRWRRTESRSALIPDEPSERRTFRPPTGRSSSVTCGGRARSSLPRRFHQKPLWFPRMPLVTKTVIGTPLDSAIGRRLGQVTR